MTNDPRLYDIISALGSNNPTKATELFTNVLEDRIADSVRQMVLPKEENQE